jgi:DNA-binding GntR family transcriptional regulator
VSARGSDTSLKALRNWYETWSTQRQEDNIEFFISQDTRFHQLICEGTGNLKLQMLLENLNEQCWWIIRLIYVPRLTAYKEHFSMEEHLAILNYIENRDADGAALAMEKHLHRSEVELMHYVEE